MVLEINNSERDLIFELIESAHREMIHEIDHTDAREFKKLLQQKLTLLEHVGAKIGPKN
jgi:predicted house-cleaning noncanonical NTP pyrophosphatase (MazG superfamily)